jgi:RNA polymerase sigma factor (sigma-70 family)
MPTPEPLIRLIYSAYAAPADGVTDTELLARLTSDRELAFELLVRRYAELVWRVCRSVTRNHHAAEDAFQATFLALATKAATVRGDLGGWLYRVAYHASLKAKAANSEHQRQADADPHIPAPGAPGTVDVVAQSELATILHDELNRLSDTYRVPLVLCHLLGFTQADAAARLGLPLGTVATRVRRGLDRLRDRLARRGVELPAAGVGAIVATNTAAVPSKLIATAAGMSCCAAPPALVQLSQGALAAMKPLSWKLTAGFAAACLTGAVALTAAVGREESRLMPASSPPPPAPATEPAAAKKFVPAPSTYAQRKQSQENLRKIGLAMHEYADATGHMPTDISSENGTPLLSWRVALLPYLDQDFLYSQFKLDEPWDSEHNRALIKHMPRVYGNAVGQPGTFVKGFSGPGAAFEPGKKLRLPQDFPDGTSNTILVVEAGPAIPWTKPEDLPYDPKKPLPVMDGPYQDRLIAMTADGAIHHMRWNLGEVAYRTLIERADGHVIDWDIEAPPANPATEEEKQQAAHLRRYLANSQEYLRGLTQERTKLIKELDKLGGGPPADVVPENASIEELERAIERLMWQQSLLHYEINRLEAELKQRKKNPSQD